MSRSSIRSAAALIALCVAPSILSAQAAPKAPRGGQPTTAPLVATLMRDVDGVSDKLVALARAIPADKYDYRPAAGVRSVREVMLHVASDNYLLPALAGTAAPTATGIDLKDFKSVDRFEKRALAKDSVVAELERSFAHLANVMGKSDAPSLTKTVSMFGQQSSMQELWIGTTTHLHEHLGQSIAYARANAVTPPWSK